MILMVQKGAGSHQFDYSAPCGKPKIFGPLILLGFRQVFGSYGIDVVQQDARLRVSNLYSIEQGGDRYLYATIAEVHHPDYLDLADNPRNR